MFELCGNESLSNVAVFIQKLSVNAYAADSPSGQYFIARVQLQANFENSSGSYRKYLTGKFS